MKNLLHLVALFSSVIISILISERTYAQAQVFEWAKSIGPVSPYGINGNALTTDSKGNVYITGSFMGTVDFDPGPGVTNVTAGSTDAYISKFNAAGELIWVKTFHGLSGNAIMDIAVDATGNIYTTGYFCDMFGGDIDFDPGPGTAYLQTTFIDPFVCKLDSSGGFVWVSHFAGADFAFNSGQSLVVDDNAVYVTGNISGIVDFDPGPGTYMVTTSIFDYTTFIVRLDAKKGGLDWMKYVEGTNLGNKVRYDPSEDAVYVLGYFKGTLDFDTDSASTFNMTAQGEAATFVLRLNTAGSFVWAKQIGGASLSSANTCYGADLAIKDGALFITGSFSGIVDLDPNSGIVTISSNKAACFIMSLDTAGTFIWGKQIGGEEDNRGSALTLDGYGNIYIIGSFSGTIDFDPDLTDSFNLTAVNTGYSPAIFILKLNPEGKFIWAGQTGQTNEYNVLNDIAVDPSGNIYSGGNYMGTCDFDPGNGVHNLTPIGDVACFILKLSCNDTSSSILTTKSCEDYVLNGIVYNSSGTYTQKISNSVGCDSTITLNLTIGPLNTYVTQTDGTLTSDETGVSYQWIDCKDNSIIPGATAQSYTPTQLGSYAVILTGGNCSDTSECYDMTTGISEIPDLKNIRLFPNPTEGKVILSTDNILVNADCKLINTLGQVVWSKKGLNGNHFNFDISTFATGIYIMEISTKNITTKHKFIKE